MGNAQVKEHADGEDAFADELAAGSTLMHGQYTIERFLNAGGFGITYAAKDSLDRRVVIKECFPGAFCRRSTVLVTARSRAHQSELASIVRLFVQEARSLAKMDHPNIVGVHQVFEENNTAYMALDFVEGQDLLEVIENGTTKLAPSVIENVLRKVLDAITFIHNQGILHRDISPDNILLDENNNPVLIDFGAAREQATKQSRVLSALRVVKDGYSPQEFYIAGSEQGAYSDLYALGATFYHLLTNDLPPNSQARLSAVASGESDPYQPLVGRVSGYSTDFLMAIDKSLEILPKDRIGSAQDWIAMMDGKLEIAAPVIPIETAKAKGAEAAKPKSKKGLFLATAAAIGVLAVGIATQTDLLKPAVETTPQVAVAPAAVDTVDAGSDQTPEIVVVESNTATAEAESAPAVEDEPVTVAETTVLPDPVVPVEDTLSVQDALAVTEPTETTVVAEAAEPEVAIQEAPAVVEPVEDTVIANSEQQSDQAVVEAEVVVAEPVAEPDPAPVQVVAAPAELQNIEPPVAADHLPLSERLAALAAVQPSTNISDVPPLVSESPVPLSDKLAAKNTPIDAQSDLDASINQPAIIDQVTIGAPSQFAPLPANGAPELPVAPNATFEIASIDTTTPEPTPEPEPVPEPVALEKPTVSDIETARRILLPYDGFFAAIEGETRIYAVNGVTVSSREEFDAVVAETLANYTDGEVELQVRVGLRPTTAEDQIWKLPVVYRTTLANGLVFDAAEQEDGWVTKVADVPSDLSIELQTGDQIFGYLGTNELLAEPTSISDILLREVLQGTTVFHFAVKRGASTWAAAFPFELSENTNSN